MRFENYTKQAAEVILIAEQVALELHHRFLMPEHLLLALLQLEEGIVPQILETISLEYKEVKKRLELELSQLFRGRLKDDVKQASLSERLVQVLNGAERSSRRQGDSLLNTTHLLFALLEERNGRAAGIMRFFGVDRARVHRILTQLKEDSSEERQQEEELPAMKDEFSIDSRRTELSKSKGLKDSFLQRYCRDLTALAETGQLDPVIGRDEEIRWMMQILSRRSKNNPVLIGEPGVGRNAILSGLAFRIGSGDLPEHLKKKRLFALDFGALIAGARYRGEFEERLKGLLQEIADTKGDVILVIPDLHQLVGGNQSGMNASNLLQPALLRGEIRCIGITTSSAYRLQIEKDLGLRRLFQAIRVEEPSEDEAIAILRGLKSRYEIHHGIRIADQALQAAVQLSDRYLSDRALPDKAIDLIDEAASRLRLSLDSMPAPLDLLKRQLAQFKIQLEALRKENKSELEQQKQILQVEIQKAESAFGELEERWLKEQRAVIDIRVLKEKIEKVSEQEREAERLGDYQRAAEIKYDLLNTLQAQLKVAESVFGDPEKTERLLREEVEASDIAQIIADWTGIPVAKMMESEREKLLKMEECLGLQVIGQPEAIRSISQAIRRSRSGLADPQRPIGSFFFLGPTGVGKTELAKALAVFLFDDERAMIRLDMSEFMEKHAATRLVGSPPGYAGHQEGGQLTEAVRHRPYSVVLFDEVEKAHQDVFNLLLQVLDDGRLTDSQGRLVDFKNTVVILTSNIGAQAILDAGDLGQGEQMKKQLSKVIEKALLGHFRPEFLNRIDETLIFNPLSFEAIRLITDIQLQKLEVLLKEKQLEIIFSSEAKQLLAERGYDPAFGARPLRRTILSLIQNPLSIEILEEKYLSGDRIEVSVDAGEITFQKG